MPESCSSTGLVELNSTVEQRDDSATFELGLTSLAFWLYIFNRPSVLSAFLCSILNPKIYFLLFRIRCEKEFSPKNQSSRSSGMHSKSNTDRQRRFPFLSLFTPRHLENRKPSRSFLFGKSKHFFFNKNVTMFLNNNNIYIIISTIFNEESLITEVIFIRVLNKYLKQWKAMQLSL